MVQGHFDDDQNVASNESLPSQVAERSADFGVEASSSKNEEHVLAVGVDVL